MYKKTKEISICIIFSFLLFGCDSKPKTQADLLIGDWCQESAVSADLGSMWEFDGKTFKGHMIPADKYTLSGNIITTFNWGKMEILSINEEEMLFLWDDREYRFSRDSCSDDTQKNVLNKNLAGAVVLGQLSLAKKYVVQGADISNVPINSDLSILMRAIDSQRMEMLEYILSLKPELDIRDKYGNNALMHAIRREKVRIVERLLKENFDLESVNSRDQTVLDMARQTNNADIALLVQNAYQLKGSQNN